MMMVMIMMTNIVVRSDPETNCCDVEGVGDEVAHVPHVAHVPDEDVDDIYIMVKCLFVCL